MAQAENSKSLFLAALVAGIVAVVSGLNFLWPGQPQSENPVLGSTEERVREEYRMISVASEHQPSQKDCVYHAKILALNCQIQSFRADQFQSALKRGSWEYLGDSIHGHRYMKADLSAILRCKATSGDTCEFSIYRVLAK